MRIAALRGAEVLLAPHRTGGCRTTNPHLMGAIERRLWDDRQATGRLWMRARRPDLYAELARPTGLERDVYQLEFEQ